jgi:hypothetical protein
MRSGRREEGSARRLETVEQLTLTLVQPPVVRDDQEDAYESNSLLCCQEEDEAALRTLGLHDRESERPSSVVGTGWVNAGGTFG